MTAIPTGPLEALPLWGFLLGAATLLGVAMEAGYRLGQWRHAHAAGEKDQPVGAMVASILGLLALVLGFTFSLAASRFDARRLAVLEEANAIGTTYLRARLLPEPERSEVARILREYVSERLRGAEIEHFQEAVARSETMHELLWSQAQSAAHKAPHSIMTGVFIQSLNEVIDLHAKRILLGVRSRIPLVIWMGLLGMALLGMAAVGYQAGLTNTLRSPAMPGLILAFALVLALIADLDRGQEGLLRISQQAMSDLQDSLQRSRP